MPKTSSRGKKVKNSFEAARGAAVLLGNFLIDEAEILKQTVSAWERTASDEAIEKYGRLLADRAWIGKIDGIWNEKSFNSAVAHRLCFSIDPSVRKSLDPATKMSKIMLELDIKIKDAETVLEKQRSTAQNAAYTEALGQMTENSRIWKQITNLHTGTDFPVRLSRRLAVFARQSCVDTMKSLMSVSGAHVQSYYVEKIAALQSEISQIEVDRVFRELPRPVFDRSAESTARALKAEIVEIKKLLNLGPSAVNSTEERSRRSGGREAYGTIMEQIGESPALRARFQTASTAAHSVFTPSNTNSSPSESAFSKALSSNRIAYIYGQLSSVSNLCDAMIALGPALSLHSVEELDDFTANQISGLIVDLQEVYSAEIKQADELSGVIRELEAAMTELSALTRTRVTWGGLDN